MGDRVTGMDWLWLRGPVSSVQGTIVGPGLIAREYAKRLFEREYARLFTTGVLRELREKELAAPDG